MAEGFTFTYDVRFYFLFSQGKSFQTPFAESFFVWPPNGTDMVIGIVNRPLCLVESHTLDAAARQKCSLFYFTHIL